MTLSVLFFYLGIEKGRKLSLWYADVFSALSFLTKFEGIILLLVFLSYLLMTWGIRWTRNRDLGLSFLFFLLVITAYFLYTEKVPAHPSLMRFLEFSLPVLGFEPYKAISITRYYLNKMAYALSAAGASFAIYGSLVALRRLQRSDILLFLWGGFFYFLFLWVGSPNDRFILHWLFPIIIFSCRRIEIYLE